MQDTRDRPLSYFSWIYSTCSSELKRRLASVRPSVPVSNSPSHNLSSFNIGSVMFLQVGIWYKNVFGLKRINLFTCRLFTLYKSQYKLHKQKNIKVTGKNTFCPKSSFILPGKKTWFLRCFKKQVSKHLLVVVQSKHSVVEAGKD